MHLEGLRGENPLWRCQFPEKTPCDVKTVQLSRFDRNKEVAAMRAHSGLVV